MNIFPDLVTARLVRKPPSHHKLEARPLQVNKVQIPGSISKCGVNPGRTHKMTTQFSRLIDFSKRQEKC